MLHIFYDTCINSFSICCLFADDIAICSIFCKFISGRGFALTIVSAISFSINFPVASAVLWTTFLEAVFVASSPSFVAVSIRFFLYLSGESIANYKNPNLLTDFVVFGCIE